nr:hypothetical protein [Pandoravirus massiliensis]
MSDGDATWSGWGAPPLRSPAPTAPFGVDVVYGGHARTLPEPATMSKNRMRRQRRHLVGNALCDSEPHQTDPIDDTQYNNNGNAIEGSPCPMESLLHGPGTGALAGPVQMPGGTRDGQRASDHSDGERHCNSDENTDDDHDDWSDGKRRPSDCDGSPSKCHVAMSNDHRDHYHPHRNDNDTTTNGNDRYGTADNEEDDEGDKDSVDDGAHCSDTRTIEQSDDRNGAGGPVRARDDRALTTARGSCERRQSQSDAHGLTRISIKGRLNDRSSPAAIVVEGDVLSCRTCGVSSTARRSSRMGVYVGDGWVVHAARRRQRGSSSSHGAYYYEIVQQTLSDFADGRTLSADEWFRTRSEFPAAVRVRRAYERVGSEWEVPDGLDDARASEDFALWTATGQSALTYADYRGDREDHDPPSSTLSAYRPSSRKKRNRRNSDERGVVARAVRVGSDSPPPVLARIHQPATATSSSATSSSTSSMAARPAPTAGDYRHAVAGGIVGLYLGGPIGGAVGGAAGLLLDSMASLGRGWRL